MIRWWKNRKGPLTSDRCQTCGKELRARDRVEVITEEDSDEWGGTGWVETYCKRDRPKVST